ncbi:MAG: hypothetical protein ABSF10_09055 [Verrucomicrobiota bacterium]
MFQQWTLCSISHWFCFNDARRFPLLFLDEFLRQFVGNLKISCPKRFPAVNRHVADAVAQVIAACRFQFVVLAETTFFNFEYHDCLHSSTFAPDSNETGFHPRFLHASAGQH